MMVAMVFLNLLLITLNASASEGPWTAPQGAHNVYLGLYGEQFRCFEAEGKQSEECASGLSVPRSVRQVGLKVFYRYGINRNWDFAVAAPFARSFVVGEPSSPSEAATPGIGLVESRMRRRLGKTGPLDWSASAGLRSGFFHKDTRGRLTNLGEGTNDLAATLSTGTTGLLGARFYTTSLDANYYYRFPLQEDDSLGAIPGDEVRASAIFDYAATARIGTGVTLDAFHRLSGADLNFGKIAKFGDDRWAALQATQVKLGGRIMMYPKGAVPYLQVGVQRTVWARNNPTDTTYVEFAMGTDIGSKKP
jgi:hypothetical protein